MPKEDSEELEPVRSEEEKEQKPEYNKTENGPVGMKDLVRPGTKSIHDAEER